MTIAKPPNADDSADHDAEHEFSLEELLAQCDPNAPAPEPTGWETRTPIGEEVL